MGLNQLLNNRRRIRLRLRHKNGFRLKRKNGFRLKRKNGLRLSRSRNTSAPPRPKAPELPLPPCLHTTPARQS